MEPDRQAYDRGGTIFSPDGRLYQVEYAREAVERGSPSVGVRTAEGTVLAARRPLRSPLVEPDSVEKIHAIDDHVVVAAAGHAADARRLVEVGREAATSHRLRYGEPIGVEALARAIADHVQEYTQTGGSRPYGTALLVAGGGDPALFEVDPSGTATGWRAGAIGDDAGGVRSILADRIDGEVETRAAGIEVAIRALADAGETPIEPGALSVAALEDGSLARLSDAEIDRFTPAS